MEKCHRIKSLLHHNVAFVAKRLESVKSVVVACTAHAHATEGNFQILDLDNGIVHASGSRCGMAQNMIDVAFVCTKDVQGEWLWPTLDKCNRFVKSLVGDNRHNRSENFGLHDFHVGRDVCEHGDRRVAVFCIAYSANDLVRPFGNSILDKGRVTFGSSLVYDVYKVFAIVALGLGVAESAFDFFCKSFGKFLNFVFWAKGVIGRDAGLSAV